MKLKDVMTREVETVRPDATVVEAARKMKDLDVGVIPVCETDNHVVGMVTDRDICIRVVAEGRDANDARCRDIMSSDVVSCREDDDVRDAAKIMQQRQIRRLAICDSQNRLVGIVSLGDLAVETGDDKLSGDTLEKVSEPARPRRAA